MRVFTYFDELPGINPDRALLELWRETWARHGWEPVVLCRDDALLADAAAVHLIEESHELRRGPCPDGYNTACHLRWIAHLSHGGLMTDYDVLNNGFSVYDLRQLIGGGRVEPIFLHANPVPCAVFGRPSSIRSMVNMILYHARRVDSGELPVSSFGEHEELSFVAHDQAVFAQHANQFFFPDQPRVIDFGGPGWYTAPLIHFCNSKTLHPRMDTIRATGLFQ